MHHKDYTSESSKTFISTISISEEDINVFQVGYYYKGVKNLLALCMEILDEVLKQVDSFFDLDFIDF